MTSIVKRAAAGALILIIGGVVVPRLASAAATQTIVRCVLAQACTSTKNTIGGGIQGITAGTTGTSAGVRGLDGSTNGGKNDGVLGSVTNGGFGVEGTSGDGAYGGVRGTATTGFGMLGISNSSYGVLGSSNTSVGVIGQSASGDASQFTASSTGTAVRAVSGTGTALIATTGGNGSSGGANSTVGAMVTNTNTGGTGAVVTGGAFGLVSKSTTGLYPLLLEDANGYTIFYVAGNGDFYSSGTFHSLVATRSGREVNAYTTQSTTRNVDDVGSAELVNGVASVTFDPAFAASIDLQTVYHVFLTPNGDTRGLYVANKTATGFVVRETQGGRGRLTFDYRIVARVLGHARDHMAFVDPQTDGRPKAPAFAIPRRTETRIPVLQLPQKPTSAKL